jgi:hypothetical protein
MIARLFALAIAAAAALAPAARADDAAPPSLAGNWRFETGVFDGDCVITGRVTFRATGLPNTYRCEFVSVQRCGGAVETMYAEVRQSCTAQQTGKQVRILSKVDRIVEERPFEDGLYYADNFIVSFAKGGTELVGGHYDVIRNTTARFWREVSDLVS